MKPIVIFGAGGFAREVLALIRDINARETLWDPRGFLDDDARSWERVLDGVPVLGGGDWLRAQAEPLAVVLGVGSPAVKLRLADRLRETGAEFPTLIHPTVVRSEYVTFGEGCVVTAGNILTSQISLGRFSMINLMCTIGHDCRLGDFVTVSPGCNVSGNVRIGTSPPRTWADLEEQLVAEAFATNWIAPLGPHVDAFEREFCEVVGARHAAALSSGTAALHLALQLVGRRAGDEVMVSTLTFSASVNPIVYLGATPVFIDSERAPGTWTPRCSPRRWRSAPAPAGSRRPWSWCTCTGRARTWTRSWTPATARRRGRGGRRRGAGRHLPGRAPGTLGQGRGSSPSTATRSSPPPAAGCWSPTTRRWIARAEAGDPGARPGAALPALGDRLQLPAEQRARGIGRGQLRCWRTGSQARRRNFEFYRDALGDLPGVEFMPEAEWGRTPAGSPASRSTGGVRRRRPRGGPARAGGGEHRGAAGLEADAPAAGLRASIPVPWHARHMSVTG
jgi:sugar O-acyltransferase (sialic acid O-acetyltransferase NeuD family)